MTRSAWLAVLLHTATVYAAPVPRKDVTRSTNARLLPYGLVASGAAMMVGGAVLGLTAIWRDDALGRELALGQEQPGFLKPATYYRDETAQIALQRTLALLALGVGAGLIGTGIFINLSEPDRSLGVVALVPNAQGLSLVGTFR